MTFAAAIPPTPGEAEPDLTGCILPFSVVGGGLMRYQLPRAIEVQANPREAIEQRERERKRPAAFRRQAAVEG